MLKESIRKSKKERYKKRLKGIEENNVNTGRLD
jgi:hypothetical protein